MQQSKIDKVAAYSTTDEIQKWTSGVGKFVTDILPTITAAERAVCKACPFRCKASIGGCITTDCPVHMLRAEVDRAVSRAGARAKELYKAKYSASRSTWAA